jgi:hypothetical protein
MKLAPDGFRDSNCFTTQVELKNNIMPAFAERKKKRELLEQEKAAFEANKYDYRKT